MSHFPTFPLPTEFPIFTELPLDIILYQFPRYLSAREVLLFSRTCRKYRAIFDDHYIWQHFIKKRYQVDYEGQGPKIIYFLLQKLYRPQLRILSSLIGRLTIENINLLNHLSTLKTLDVTAESGGLVILYILPFKSSLHVGKGDRHTSLFFIRYLYELTARTITLSLLQKSHQSYLEVKIGEDDQIFLKFFTFYFIRLLQYLHLSDLLELSEMRKFWDRIGLTVITGGNLYLRYRSNTSNITGEIYRDLIPID